MAKLGKFSTGLSGAVAASAYGGKGSKGGYAQRQNMMGENGLKKHYSAAYGDRHTATGNKTMTVSKNVKRKT